jgi:hypothetical protein
MPAGMHAATGRFLTTSAQKFLFATIPFGLLDFPFCLPKLVAGHD